MIKRGGLWELPIDERDYQLGAIFPKKEKAPDNFLVGLPKVRDQGRSDVCTGFATCSASELQEHVLLNPWWSFAVSKMISDNPNEWGQDLRTALKVHSKFGAIEEAIYSSHSKFRKVSQYPKGLFEKAIIHRKQSFFRVRPKFKDIKRAMWQHKAACITGAKWRNEWDKEGVIPEVYGDYGFGHSFIFIGARVIEGKSYLIAHLSNGTRKGDDGRFYFPESVVNREIGKYGAFMFVDFPQGMSREDIIKLSQANIFKKIWLWIRSKLF